jgi:hypothetical protein
MSHANQTRIEEKRKFSVNGRCRSYPPLQSRRRGCNKKIKHKLVQIKIDCDSSGEVMADEDDDVVVDGDRVIVVEAVGD